MGKLFNLIYVLFFTFALLGCKDECPCIHEGTLRVVFNNPDYSDTPRVSVSTLDTHEEIMEVEVINHESVEFNLNIGNYRIQPLSYKHTYLMKNVQIQQGKTVTLTFD